MFLEFEISPFIMWKNSKMSIADHFEMWDRIFEKWEPCFEKWEPVFLKSETVFFEKLFNYFSI